MMELLPNTDATWSQSKKILFRFLCVYVVLYALSHPFGVPLGEFILEYYNLLWDSLVPWVGEHVLRLSYEITVKPAGSGDTTYNYVQILSMVVLSGFLCLLWSLADRKRDNCTKLFYWLCVSVRYYLAVVLLSYGFIKVFKVQFPFPHLERLITPYGESSPMGLLWAFMGYSTPYTVFAGLGEVLGGALLFFRRTTTLGALVVIGVMSNVVMLNFGYDVPVKLFSVHLLLMGGFLVAPDVRRVVGVFVLNQPASAAALSAPFSRRWMNRGRMVVKVVLIGYVIFTQISDGLEAKEKWGDNRPKPALYGLYEVETFVHNGDTLAPLITDTVRWRKMIVDWEGFVGIKMMDDQIARYAFEPDTVACTITMYTRADTTQKSVLHYERPALDELVVEGVLQGDTLSVHMKQFDLQQFTLVDRGFHWINEYPFNR